MQNEQHTQQSAQKQARAGTAAVLRIIVACYLVYLAVQLIRGVQDGSSAMSPVIAWIAALFFTAAAAAFCLYTWKQYRQDAKKASRQQGAESDSQD